MALGVKRTSNSYGGAISQTTHRLLELARRSLECGNGANIFVTPREI